MTEQINTHEPLLRTKSGVFEPDSDNQWQDNFPCDFCGVEIENVTCEFGGMSAFTDGSAYTNLGYDDRVACEDCCGQIEFEEED